MKKILVVEDTHTLRKDILEMLRFEGYDVRGAEDGLTGVQVAREYLPDLIICDILMPGLNGIEVLVELKKDPLMTTTPFIFLTAKADKIDVRKGMELGADDYVTKPFSASELINSVRTQISKQEERDKKTEEKIHGLRERIILALPHEIRTPLTSIMGFSDIIATDCYYREPEQIIEMANYINDAGARLYRLAENYLAYAQLEVMHTNPEWFTLLEENVTLDSRLIVHDTALQKAQEVDRETDVQVTAGDDVPVRIRPDHLKKIVEELVDNALKFSQRGTGVEVSTAVKEGYYHVEVLDHGRGMTADQVKEIGAYMQFGRKWFEQQGLGLGLIIARRLSEVYGGETIVESVPDQYTRVTVKLPVAK